MTKLTLALSFLFVTTAAAADLDAVRRHVERTLQRCPDQKITLTPIKASGPSNFEAWGVEQTSSDQYCRTRAVALVSKQTGQVVVGSVFDLPPGPQKVDVKISDFARRAMQKPAVVKLDPMNYPDGLKRAVITTESQHGPYSISAWLDASQRFLIVGRPGKLGNDPGKDLLKAIGAASAPVRGKKDAAVEIIEISDFQCPSCRQAHEALEPFFEKHLGKIRYKRLDLPLYESHDWSLSAALGARAIHRTAPQKYWDYVGYIFENQQIINRGNVDEMIRNFVEVHELDWNAFQKVYNSKEELRSLITQKGALSDADINGTPTYLVNGQAVYWGNNGDALKKYVQERLSEGKGK